MGIKLDISRILGTPVHHPHKGHPEGEESLLASLVLCHSKASLTEITVSKEGYWAGRTTSIHSQRCDRWPPPSQSSVGERNPQIRMLVWECRRGVFSSWLGLQLSWLTSQITVVFFLYCSTFLQSSESSHPRVKKRGSRKGRCLFWGQKSSVSRAPKVLLFCHSCEQGQDCKPL